MLNYLARLGWSHGDDELFSREQMVAWFDGSHLAKSPAQWDPAKLTWVNAHYIKQADDARLAGLVAAQLAGRGLAVEPADDRLAAACALFKDRCNTVVELADWLEMYVAPVQPTAEDLAAHVTDAVRPALSACATGWPPCPWDKAGIALAMKDTLAEHKLKMPLLAMPLRVLVCGRTQTPSIDAVLALFPRETVLHDCAGSGTLYSWSSLEQRLCSKSWTRLNSASGGIAQLGERLHGMQEVSGSIPLTSTNFLRSKRCSNDVGHVPFV
jgi:glutamyl-tRNA synthetase